MRFGVKTEVSLCIWDLDLICQSLSAHVYYSQILLPVSLNGREVHYKIHVSISNGTDITLFMRGQRAVAIKSYARALAWGIMGPPVASVFNFFGHMTLAQTTP